MTIELRVSIFSSEVEIAVPSELSGVRSSPQGSSLRMRAESDEVARTLARLIEMLDPQLRGDCLIKLAVHERSSAASRAHGPGGAPAPRTRIPSSS